MAGGGNGRGHPHQGLHPQILLHPGVRPGRMAESRGGGGGERDTVPLFGNSIPPTCYTEKDNGTEVRQ